MIRIWREEGARLQPMRGRHGRGQWVLLLAAWGGALAAQAQQAIYRCGNTYTNQPSQAALPSCVRVTGGNITVVQTSPGAVAGPPSKPASPAASRAAGAATRVAPDAQRARDAQARQILQDELQKAQTRRDAAARAYQNGQPERLGEETRNYQKYLDRVAGLKDTLNRAESDVAGLQRELARLPAGGAN